MAKILYGVAGEGMGHAMRSKPIIDGLKKDHEIEILTGDNAFKILSKEYKNVHEIDKLDIVYKETKVCIHKTIFKNLKDMPSSFKSLQKVDKIIRKFKPDIIISDFEPFTNYIAKIHQIPLVIIDNPSVLRKCKISVPKKFLGDYVVACFVAGSIVNFANYYLLTTFFKTKSRSKRVFLYPPIVRDEIINAKPSKKGHIIVYQTSHNYDHLIPILKKIPSNVAMAACYCPRSNHSFLF